MKMGNQQLDFHMQVLELNVYIQACVEYLLTPPAHTDDVPANE